MTVIIHIHYTSVGSKSFQRAEIQLRGKLKERAAYEFWKWIQKQLPYGGELEQVLVENEDITEAVLALEKQEQLKAFYAADNLPF
ncbi:hypothetical protein J1P26_17120 [Neobacillus sp. MM2021_6]|uniref:hypothetical protein n=1 Tax=Bacillaceae TaxID=186817 RepID=UPI00140BA8BF|nr:MULTISPECIES: hypothetical protein [Bacillaceae]MBO0961429.1 hypothetical protein [Neobacillus sp. MM2021_6]NHC19533.1 hypothetical protein [Bacillus sp. MM2020_4]